MAAPNTTITEQYSYLTQQHPCDPQTCPFQLASIRYPPTLGGNVFYLLLFIFLWLAQAFFAYRHSTWSYTGSICAGLIFETVGYGSRIMLHKNPFSNDAFLLYIIRLTIGPAFFTAAIYLRLARIVVRYGEGVSRVKPRTYTIGFICSDAVALVLQELGGAFATSSKQDTSDMGVDIMIAGLAWQVIAMVSFVALSAAFVWKAHKNRAL